MTLFDRIEKKIFFRIVRVLTFIIAFIALIATVTGVYTLVDSTFEAKAKKVLISTDEVNQVLQSSTSATADAVSPAGTEVASVTAPTTPVLSPEEQARTDLATNIAKKFLKAFGTLESSPDYKNEITRTTDAVLGDFGPYDQDTAISVLTQIDELSNGFAKTTFEKEYDAARLLFLKKYEHEQQLVEQKNLSNQMNKMQGSMVFAGGIVIFALFVMILVLMRIEKNTRPANAEDETFEGSDKKIFFSIIGIAILIAMASGWIYTHGLSGDNDFDAVDEATRSMPSANTTTEEVAPAAEAVAPASEAMPADIEAVDAAAPAVEATPTPENDNQEAEPAQ
jgi:hypothetical protein